MAAEQASFGPPRIGCAGVAWWRKEPAMNETPLLHEPQAVTHQPQSDMHEPDEPGLVLGRPVEDRSFEVVEAGIGLAAGLAIGTAVAGPIGTVVGGLVGAATGIVAGEAVERAVGRAATTTDATEPEPPTEP
jgi:hypothetical protein